MKYLVLVLAVLFSATVAADWYKPAPHTRMHIQYAGSLNTGLNVDVYNIDLVDTTQTKINQIKANGKKVICYFSAGSWEDWRPDAAAFPASVKGLPMDGWVGEKWLDVSNLSVLMPIMEARLDLAVTKGCDAVDPDNTDGWDGNNTGFNLTQYHAMAYIASLANAAHARGLGIGLKNNPNLVNYIPTYVDFAVVEQCHEYNECDAYDYFPANNKAVFQIEYNRNPTVFCPVAEINNFDAQKKYLSLSAYNVQCR